MDKLVPATTLLVLSQLLLAPPLTQTTNARAGELTAVLPTSDTEGMPKGAMLTHNNVLISERAYCVRLDLTWQNVFLIPAPLGHATGSLHGVTTSFLTGARSVLLDILTPTACFDLLEQQHCTRMLGTIPFIYNMLCSVEERLSDISSLRFLLCGDITIPRKTAHDCQQLDVESLGIYGSTEGSLHALANLDDSLSRMINTDGYTAAGIEIKVVDEARNTLPMGVKGGEASRSPNVFMGYLDKPEFAAHALDQNGQYYSGGLCRMGNMRYIKIIGRRKDIIVRGGENISSHEVEGTSLQHPHIHDACVVAMPDERLGERLCVYVVLKLPHHSPSLESVVAFSSHKRATKCKYPEHIVIMEKLPRTTSGKVRKYQLRQDIVQRLSVESITG